MIEIEKYARAAASTARTPPNSPARRAALEVENAARVAAEQFAANREQRIADLETKVDTLKRLHDAATAERDELAHGHRSQHDADSAELRRVCADRDAARKERDELRAQMHIVNSERAELADGMGALRARLAEIEGQKLASPKVAPSQTAGMSMAQRILHVGGRNNSAGYVEFGSVQAVEALVRQALRDANLHYAHLIHAIPDGWKLMAVDCDIGTLPVQMLHDGLTECEWMREGGR